MADSRQSGLVEVSPGLRLNVQVEGPDGAPVLLLSNSLGSTLAMWDGVASRLRATYRVVRYDTRGHGGSDVPQGPYSIADLGGDAVALLNALGIRQAAMCGLSLGGMTTMWVAANIPDRLTHAVLANTAAFLPPAAMWRERAATVRAGALGQLVEPSMSRWFTEAFRARAPGLVAEGAAMVAGTPHEGYAGCCEAIAAVDQREDIRRIAIPTLVIVGDQDPSTSPAMGEEMRAAIPGASLVSLQAAHLSAMEVPDAFSDALISWFQAR